MYCNSSVFARQRDRMVGSGQKAKCCVTGGDTKKMLMQHVRSFRDYTYLHGNQNE